METLNDLVGYHNLKIYQNNSWFKFSLESVLLPNFATINPSYKNILDLCTGNAPIPLILSTRTKAKIIGVEYQSDIYNLAVKSIKINNLESQIDIINDDIKKLKKYYDSDYFDLITVNPPYFKNEVNSAKNNDIHKTIARHEISVNLNDVIEIASFLLKNGGRLAMVHRTERFMDVLQKLNESNLRPKRIRFIYPKTNKKSNLFMIECIKNGKSEVIVENPLIVHNDDGTYQDEIMQMFQIKRVIE